MGSIRSNLPCHKPRKLVSARLPRGNTLLWLWLRRQRDRSAGLRAEMGGSSQCEDRTQRCLKRVGKADGHTIKGKGFYTPTG